MAIEPRHERTGWVPSRATLALGVFLAIGVFFLITEHTAHFFGALPFMLLLLCPLMHLFMHGGHGSRTQSRGDQPHHVER